MIGFPMAGVGPCGPFFVGGVDFLPKIPFNVSARCECEIRFLAGL
ncbi:hypothetical protein [Synechococcus sp. M16CYN]